MYSNGSQIIIRWWCGQLRLEQRPESPEWHNVEHLKICINQKTKIKTKTKTKIKNKEVKKMAYALRAPKRRLFEEQGTVLAVTLKDKMDEWKTSDGKIIEAKPERYSILVVSANNFNPATGFEDATIGEFEVEDLKEGSKFRYGDKVRCVYEQQSSGVKAVEIHRVTDKA